MQHIPNVFFASTTLKTPLGRRTNVECSLGFGSQQCAYTSLYQYVDVCIHRIALFSPACQTLYMTVCIDLCALTTPVCGLSFTSIKSCSVLVKFSAISSDATAHVDS